MPVSLNNPITQADMDALAALANGKLLPLINGVNGSGDLWIAPYSVREYGSGGLAGKPVTLPDFNYYDVPVATTAGAQDILNPQPDYLFDASVKNWGSEFNRIRGDVMASFIGLPALSFYLNHYAGFNYNFNMGNLAVPGAENLFLNPSVISSGPFVVDVNDPDTFPSASYQGILQAGIPTRHCFRNIEFWGKDSDVLPCLLQLDVVFPVFNDAMAAVPATTGYNDFAFTLRTGLTAILRIYITLYLQGSPPGGIAALTANSGCTVVSESSTSTGGGNYTLELVLDVALAPGDIAVTFSTNIPQQPNIGSIAFPPEIHTDKLTFTDSPYEANMVAIGPTTGFSRLKSPQYGGEYLFFIGTGSTIATATVTLSNPNTKGVWVAKTPPMPGRNVYLDQCFPPFVGAVEVVGNIDADSVAVSASLPSYGDGLLVSSMRQQATMLAANGTPKADFGMVQSSMAARPAPYPTLRDTDFVPFDFGYHGADGWSVIQSASNASATTSALYFLSVGVSATATKLKLRCVAAGTARKGWKYGVLQYGEPLATTFTLYVKRSAPPTTSVYDFKVTSNSLDLDPDGGPGFLASVLGGNFFVGIENTSGATVGFDFLLEEYTIDPATVRRQFFPAVNECFTYALTTSYPGRPNHEWPGAFQPLVQAVGGDAGTFKFTGRRKIPQNGYCIFKLRATRLPVTNAAGISVIPASGDELVITVGQNRLNADGTLTFIPFGPDLWLPTSGDTGIGSGDDETTSGGWVEPREYSIRIAADASTSGDVAVFWPVLGGNEIVYRCSAPVVFEAWADWQPVFFNIKYGGGVNYPFETDETPIFFKYALSFVNFMDVTLAGYDYRVGVAQYLMTIEHYNDLENCLNLLP